MKRVDDISAIAIALSPRRGPRVTSTLILAVSLLFTSACGTEDTGDSAGEPPNIVLIVIDALRASNVSFLGYERRTTPNLDELANQSFVFSHAISVGGNTPTAMSGLMTGRYPFIPYGDDWSPPSAFGMRRFYSEGTETGPPKRLRLLAEQLQGSGYTTAGFITNPYLKKVFNFDRGFGRYEEIFREQGIPYGTGESVSAAALDFLGSAPRDPFFLYLHYMDTHGPYSPPPDYRNRFGEVSFEPAEFGELWQAWENPRTVDEAELETLAVTMRNLYDGAVSYVDESIAHVLRDLEEKGLMENTVIAITADHGEEFLEHGGTTHRGTLYEELVRVPLLLHFPGKGGGRIDELVRNFDLMPTLLELAHVETSDQELDAVSLLPLLDGRAESLRLTSYAGFPNVRMLRSARFKLLQFHNGRREFYDLDNDPRETRDLYPAHLANQLSNPTVQRSLNGLENRLSQLVEAFELEQSNSSPVETDVDQATRDQLRALGYVD